jgi:hypothetical protein
MGQHYHHFEGEGAECSLEIFSYPALTAFTTVCGAWSMTRRSIAAMRSGRLRAEPDKKALAYLAVIAAEPEAAARALERKGAA